MIVIHEQIIDAIRTRDLLHQAGGEIFCQIHQISNQFREFFHYSFFAASPASFVACAIFSAVSASVS